jgi:hypothetical protein
MSFGYSAGDFLTAASLIVQAGLALHDAGGSAQEYRQLNLYLSTVQRVLGHVDKLEPVESLADTVNAIKATALTCQHPLREFLNAIEKYGPSLDLGQLVGLMRDTERKLRWRATNKARAADRLQAQLAGYVGSINMLMGLYLACAKLWRKLGIHLSPASLSIPFIQCTRMAENHFRNSFRLSMRSYKLGSLIFRYCISRRGHSSRYRTAYFCRTISAKVTILCQDTS